MSRTKTTIEKRVAAIMRQVKKLERKGHNDDGDYDYTRATDVFEEVRDRLFGAGILLMRDESEPSYVDRETNGEGLLQECRLRVTYWFADGATETKPMNCNGLARDLSDKSLPKAQTGADKAFLKRFGLMAEVIDDPEFDGAQETLDDVAKPRASRKEKPLRKFEVENIREAMAASRKTEAQLSEFVAGKYRVPSLEEVKQKDFKHLLGWASDGQGTLAPPKLQAAPAQPSLPLGRPKEAIEMKIGNQKITIEPKGQASYSV